MSPAQNPSGRPSSITLYGSQFASSNSTANRFLGATQRPWMTNGGGLSHPGRSYPRSPVNTQTRHSNASSRQSSTTTRTTQPPARIETSDHHSTAHPSDSTIAQPTQAGPVSPVTPGTGYSENDIQPPAAKVTRLDNAVPTASFPTPEPSNASLASPVVAVTDRVSSPSRDVPASLPGAGTQPALTIKWEDTLPTTSPLSPAVGASPVQRAAPPPQRQPQYQAQPQPHQTRPVQQQPQQQPQLPQSSLPHKSHRIWQHARERLRMFLIQPSRTHPLSETVELPRVRILQDACSAEDMFYLALHQTFCLSSADPSQLRDGAEHGIRPDLDFDVVAQLLVDNKRLSKEFLQWSIEYPMPFQALLSSNDYRNALKQVSNCLSTISNHWPVFEREIRARGYPPQVDELVVRLGVESPVFQTIVFTAVSRRLFGGREELFKACISVFEEDQRTYNQRSALPPNARGQAMYNYFERYRRLCASHGMLVLPETRRVHTASTPPSSAQTPAPMTVTSPTMPIRQNNSQHRASISVPHQQPSNPQPITHPHPHAPPRPLPASRHHVSPNMAPHAGQQRQQQQVPHQINALPTGGVQHVQAHQQHSYPPQFSGRFPLPPAHYTIASQSSVPVATARANQMLPPNIQMQPSFPPVANSMQASPAPPTQYFSPVMGAHMVPAHPSPVHSPYSTTQPSPSTGGQVPCPPHPQGHPQPVPSVPLPFPVQLTGTPFTMYPPMSSQVLHPHLATPLPVRHTPKPEPPDVIQFFTGFSVTPQKLLSNRSSFTWKFTLPDEVLRLRPSLVRRPNNGGFIPLLSDGNMSFRLRCIKFPGSENVESISLWSQAESQWPDIVYIHVNNKEIHRSPNAKNAPININSYLVSGTNEVRINVLHSRQQRAADTSYFVAVEILQVNTPESFRKLVRKLPAQETRQQILARLSSSNADDDDVMIVDDFISINLRDPFTTRIFDIPARGSLCTHKECFDLSTFLQTIAAKPLSDKHKIYIRCPICRKDARPGLLLIDEFLSEVRDTLSKENKLETAKAIRVKSDGSWSAVLDTESDNRTTGRKRDRSSFESDNIKDESRPHTATPQGFPH
ncbi:MIZ zinc finger domain protein [Talaromyces stipitatus ATCC 10500]|uniref:MIZ zinc finger domain protein n=1 Tax=Talaromyces stipitatus (strain ATCC 10500 / CBS 375.48 / QM 6759 / NRRL 1006) TaxID=441959 RepID=B8MEC6_TALSN|nr:MIZ zinc finger domain protein [Talaromyces stipitatus ATCC 10500]EED16553.1 MIZ zinc finger domain protein [Talaromyces stipitatus ATCC 10500]